MSEPLGHPSVPPQTLAALGGAQSGTEVKARSSTKGPAGRRSLVFKLTLLVGLTLAVLVATIVVANGLFWQSVLRKTVDNHLSAMAVSRRDTLRAQMAQLQQRVELNTDRGELRGYLSSLSNGTDTNASKNRDTAQQTLSLMVKSKPVIGVMVADTTGHVVLTTNASMMGRDVSTYASYQAGLDNPYFGVPQLGKDGHNVAMISAPIRAREDPHHIHGVLLVTNDITALEDAFRDRTGLGETGEAILGMSDGKQIRYLIPPRNSPPATGTSADSVPALKAATENRESLVKGVDQRGIAVIAAGCPLGYSNWGLVIKMDTKEAYLPILHVVQLEVLSGAVVIGLGLIAAYFLARSFTHPVRQLTRAASRVTEGDYETMVPVKSADEFGTLSTNFNEMTTAIRARRMERDRAEEALRHADRRKDEFLAMLGHELRNPLSAIANAVRLWNVAGDDHSAVELAHGVIERQTDNLSRLVDDLLDVARITEGKIELRKRPVDVNESIHRVVEALRPAIDQQRHELQLLLENDAKIWVDADPTRVEQIISNLLTNAIKYTRKGGEIRIEARREGHEAVISVNDTGIGIAPRMLPQIFDLFTQGDHSLDRPTGGLGIGLSLCRRLVELHGGTITAFSEGVGRGSTFTVHLPTISAPESTMLPETTAQPVPPGRQRRIMLVDDNQDTVHSLARLLTLRGHVVATAFDGVAALKLAQEFQPDFLLLDLGLPGLDGYELARRLRAQGFIRTPIVAISGYAQEGDRIRSREAGFNYHFAKPVDFEALAELIVEDPITGE
ncbi:integral membrane sensor hybrid histidine kinase [Chthoniobacter flavus Ellin428]|uniref:histidine kinase n=1 Tax=Chthoniobacter flavus Ellin428 TaxID=497964 RepID=B4D2K0_9BACT|nr:ATP-binding protein [Chthoniobacter flavus]EDY19440.1 integral membrane sensor hybrid histidine kinase [Chthoniobacter flavus Ellin428]TCO90434.1 signal transduction histidine kinase [Chthoniobacter flavus]